MYITINEKKGTGIELSSLSNWQDSSYTEQNIIGFDFIIHIKHAIHLLAFVVNNNHVALCLLNKQIVYFWTH